MSTSGLAIQARIRSGKYTGEVGLIYGYHSPTGGFEVHLYRPIGKRRFFAFDRLDIRDPADALIVANMLPEGKKRDKAIASLVGRRLSETAQPGTPLLDEINLQTLKNINSGIADQFFVGSPLLYKLGCKKKMNPPIHVYIKSGKNEGSQGVIVGWSDKHNGYEVKFWTPLGITSKIKKQFYSFDRLRFLDLESKYTALCLNPNLGRKHTARIAQLVAQRLQSTIEPVQINPKIGGAYGRAKNA